MNTTQYKKARGVEFCNLFEELKAKGIRVGDVARKLGKTPSAISQYLSGATNPTLGTLEVMRLWTAELLNKDPLPEPEMPTQAKLAELEHNDPDAFAVARATVDALHKRMKRPTDYNLSSNVPSELKAGVEKAAEKFRREGQKS